MYVKLRSVCTPSLFSVSNPYDPLGDPVMQLAFICLAKLFGSYLGQRSTVLCDVTQVWDQTDLKNRRPKEGVEQAQASPNAACGSEPSAR